MVRRARAIIFHMLSRKIWDPRLADQKQSPFEEKFRVILLSSNLLPSKTTDLCCGLKIARH